MQKRRKQLLGLVGLAIVAAMTIFAITLPAPGVSAEDGSATSPATKVQVMVVQEGEMPSIEITSLESGETVVNRQMSIALKYAKSTKLKLFIKDIGSAEAPKDSVVTTPNAQIGEVEIPLVGASCVDASGNRFIMGEAQEVEFDLGYGTCEVPYTLVGDFANENGTGFVTRAVATNARTGATNSDAVDFIYRAAKFGDEIDYNPETGDPIVTIEMSCDVAWGDLIILDKNGKPIFGNTGTEQGTYPAIRFEGCDANNTSGSQIIQVTLPFQDKAIPSGTYDVVLVAYSGQKNEDGSDQIIALAYTKVDYEYKPPKVPDTGANFLRELNISQRDYLITGLLAFGMVSGFAIFLIFRRNKR